MLFQMMTECLDKMIDLHHYSKLTEYEKRLRKLDIAERCLRRMRRELLSKAYIEWTIIDK